MTTTFIYNIFANGNTKAAGAKASAVFVCGDMKSLRTKKFY